MCLNTEKFKKKPTIKGVTQITKRKKVCWKRFIKSNGFLITPFQRHVWPEEGEVSVENFTTRIRRDWYAGSHHRYFIAVDQGLHAHCTEQKAKQYRRPLEGIRMMIIPKGTKFILGTEGRAEIVALKMRLATKEEIQKHKEKELKNLTKKK